MYLEKENIKVFFNAKAILSLRVAPINELPHAISCEGLKSNLYYACNMKWLGPILYLKPTLDKARAVIPNRGAAAQKGALRRF